MAKKIQSIKTKLWCFIKKWAGILLNPRMLLCLGIAWMITNGWSYVFVALGIWLDIPWMVITGTAYMSFLWIPFTPEKIITIIIAIFLLKAIFPKDEKTLGTLKKELKALKVAFKRQIQKHKEKKAQRKASKQKDIIDVKS